MRVVRYLEGGRARFGILDGTSVFAASGSPYDGTFQKAELAGHVDEQRLLPPVQPSKVVCVGLNYAAHAAELGFSASGLDEPIIFLKPPSAIIGPNQPIVIANPEHRTDYEAELTIVIGRRARHVAEGSALDYVLGYTAANDVCDRVIQEKDGQWMRAKGFDTYCPLGPWIETTLDVADVAVQARLNGELRQSDTTAHMIFKPAYLVAFVSRVMTLEPGDVILTGTPHGIGAMHPGDTIEIEIGGIGLLRNPVVS